MIKYVLLPTREYWKISYQ